MATPGTNAIVEITTQYLATDPPRDLMTNHLSFNSTSTGVTPANWQTLTDTIKNAWFSVSGAWTHYDTHGGKVVAYDRAQPKPRPEAAVSTYTPSTWASTVTTPRQIALVVSMYAVRNLPRQRGRVFLPFHSDWSPAGERPGAPVRTAAMALLHQIAASCQALTPEWTLAVYSAKTDQNNGVTNIWCNDVWDTQRRRTPKETTRSTQTVP